MPLTIRVLKMITILLFSLSLLNAQEKKGEEKKKEKEYAHDHQEVIVTAKKEIITEIANVREVKLEELEKRGATDPIQALETIPGFFATVGSRGEAVLQLRGFSQRQVVTMIDGIPIYVPFDGQVDLSQIPIEGLAKISVTKGISSTIYGSNTMGGVVNLVTQAPTQETKFRLSLNKGSTVDQRLAFSLGKKWERIGFWVSGEHKQSDGFSLPKSFEPRPNEDGSLRQNSDLKTMGVNGRVQYSWERGSLFFDLNYVDSEKGVPPHVSEQRPRYWRFTTWRKNDIKISLKHSPLDRLELKGSIYYDLYCNVLDSYDDSSYTTQTKNYAFHSTFDDYSIGANFFGDYSTGRNHVRVGMHLKKDIHRSQADSDTPWERYEAATYSLGIEDEVTLKENLSLILGASLDWLTPLYTNGGDLRPSIFHLNPLFGFAYSLNQHTFTFSAARKSRFPTLKEFYSEYLGRNLPNPELREEKSINYEAAFRTFLSKDSRLELSLFCSDLRDLIVRKRVDSLYQMQNIDRAVFLGAEISLGYKVREGYDLSFSYSYLRARNTSAERSSSRLEYKPPHTAAVVFTYRLPLSLEGMLKVLAADRRYYQASGGEFLTLSPYALVDLRFSRTIGRFEVFILGKNIFDQSYEYEWGFPGPGREFLAGISWKLQ